MISNILCGKFFLYYLNTVDLSFMLRYRDHPMTRPSNIRQTIIQVSSCIRPKFVQDSLDIRFERPTLLLLWHRSDTVSVT